MLNIMMFISMIFNLMFLNFNNPLIMGLLMLMQTMILIMIMGKINYSFWFSYIMFLVFIGGLFILFIYIISLIYNNKFYFMKTPMFLLFSSIMLLTMNYKNPTVFNYETNLMNFSMLKENYINSMKLYNMPNNYINIMLIMYLLLLMIVVVKITNFLMGPIRSMN